MLHFNECFETLWILIWNMQWMFIGLRWLIVQSCQLCVLSNIERKELKSPTLIVDLSGYFCNTVNILKLCFGMQLSFLEQIGSSYVLLLWFVRSFWSCAQSIVCIFHNRGMSLLSILTSALWVRKLSCLAFWNRHSFPLCISTRLWYPFLWDSVFFCLLCFLYRHSLVLCWL